MRKYQNSYLKLNVVNCLDAQSMHLMEWFRLVKRQINCTGVCVESLELLQIKRKSMFYYAGM